MLRKPLRNRLEEKASQAQAVVDGIKSQMEGLELLLDDMEGLRDEFDHETFDLTPSEKPGTCAEWDLLDKMLASEQPIDLYEELSEKVDSLVDRLKEWERMAKGLPLLEEEID